MALKNMNSKNETKRFKPETQIALFRTIVLGLIFFGTILYMFAKKDIGCVVHGESMLPTYKEGDEVVATKIADASEISRYDIVVVNSKRKQNTNLIKRVIALPKENIKINKDGQVFVNGIELNSCYSYWLEKMNVDKEISVTLGDNEFFIIGDNVNNSFDSRADELGAVSVKDILGVVK